MENNLKENLRKNDLRRRLIQHRLLKQMKRDILTKAQITIILAQWYHPLHYFPVFLSRTIAISPDLKVMNFLGKILWQEIGQGNILQSHESIFLQTMKNVGFHMDEIVNIKPLPATIELLDTFRGSSTDDYYAALGSVFATEAADLAMVSAIGSSVCRLTSSKKLPWVDIHIKQEPDHTESVENSLSRQMTRVETDYVLTQAINMWKHWANFFDNIKEAIDEKVGFTNVV